MLFLPALVLLWGCSSAAAAGRLRTFHLEPAAMNISEARDTCLSHHTDLVTIYDDNENNELKNMLNNVSYAWIGARTGFQWSDGANVTYNNLTGQCGKICCTAMKSDGNWESLQCSVSKNFTCFDKETRSYILILQNRSWSEAQLYCRENHTDLASIRNIFENGQVQNAGRNSTNPFWIGFTYNKVTWFDGGESTFDKSEDTYESDKMFTYLSQNGGWSKSSASETKPALCYKSFIRVSRNKMSWEDALDFCNDSGPLRIESENDQIETERELRRRKISGPVWVGLRQSRIFGFWIWANGLNLERYQNWKGGRQPEHQKSHHCGAMEKVEKVEKVEGSFKWKDKDCRSKFIALCERR